MMNLIRNEEGATALEYGLLAALIAGVISGAVLILGGVVEGVFNNLATTMQNAVGTTGS